MRLPVLLIAFSLTVVAPAPVAAQIGAILTGVKAAKAARLAAKLEPLLAHLDDVAKAEKYFEAAGACDEIAKVLRAENTAEDISKAATYEARALEYRTQGAAASANAITIAADKAHGVVFRTFTESFILTPRIVSSEVRAFARSFVRGGQNPRQYLAATRRGSAASQLIERWLSTDLSKRVFIAGAGEDMYAVRQLQQKLEAQGHVVFFYRFCEPSPRALCDSETVGAFFATAGHAVVSDSAVARRSEFLPAEIAAGVNVSFGRGNWLMVTPVEVEKARFTTMSVARLLPFVRPQGTTKPQ